MTDPIKNLFRERMAGHEVDVPEGTWEHIQGQLTGGLSGEALRERLQEQFSTHEVHVDPSAWAHISGQLGHAAAVGTSFSTAWIAAGASAIALTAGLIWWSGTSNPPTASRPETPATELRQNTPSTEPATTVALETGTGNQAVEPATIPVPRSVGTEPGRTAHVVDPAAPGAEQLETGRSEPVANVAPSMVIVEQSPIEAETEKPAVQPIATAVQSPAPTATQQGGTPAPAIQREEPAGTETPVTEQEVLADDPFAHEAATDIFIPNVFSPQGDGVNDKLKIVANGYERAEVRVVSAKTGTQVFESNDLARMWDGRLANGNIAEEGYYRCVVLLTDADGRTRIKTEVVRLYR